MAIDVSRNGKGTHDRSTAPGSGHPDPVGELRFQVELGTLGGKRVGMFAECSGLMVEYDVFPVEEGGENRFAYKFRGRAKYQNLVLKRGVTHEETLMKWFYRCQDQCERHSVTVSLVGPDLKPVRTWTFADAFPVKWQGPTLNAASNGVATETLEIAHHGFAPTS